MKKLIIIPAYNEGENLKNTIKNIQTYAPSFDYVIVNDCSKDNTRELCKTEKFHVINLPVNLGIGGAVQTGYQYAMENDYDLASLTSSYPKEYCRQFCSSVLSGSPVSS